MLKLDYVVLCEFARPEPGGKFSLIGVFPNGIGVPMLPFQMNFLTFFQVFKADSAGQYTITAKLSQLGDGHVLATATGKIQVQAPAMPIVAPLPLINLKFSAFGAYHFSVEVEGQTEPFVTEFTVSHVPPAPLRFIAGPGPGPGVLQ